MNEGACADKSENRAIGQAVEEDNEERVKSAQNQFDCRLALGRRPYINARSI